MIADRVIHGGEAGLINFDLITMLPDSLCLGQAHRANWRMAEDNRCDILIVEMTVALMIVKTVC